MASSVAAWPMTSLNELVKQDTEYITQLEPRMYLKLSVKWWGKGAVLDLPTDGATVRMSRHQLAKPGQVIVSEIWAKHGSIGIVPPEGAGALVTNHFFLFYIDTARLLPQYMGYLIQANYLTPLLADIAQGTTGYAAIRPHQFVSVEIPLPPLDEQRRIVARIEALASRIEEARGLRRDARVDMRHLLLEGYTAISDNAIEMPIGQVAPLVRRPVAIDSAKEYPELGIRSFGKGTFHKPPLPGTLVGTKKLFAIEPGDLLFNIVFAWEGAVAVAQAHDAGRVGSHRFLTCVPVPGVARASYLCFHFLTERGLHDLGEASPGGAGRNRTLGLKALEKIAVPIPPLDAQLWFERLLSFAGALERAQTEADAELDALLPSVLDRAFRGELQSALC